jgi:hypothetical protein
MTCAQQLKVVRYLQALSIWLLILSWPLFKVVEVGDWIAAVCYSFLVAALIITDCKRRSLVRQLLSDGMRDL